MLVVDSIVLQKLGDDKDFPNHLAFPISHLSFGLPPFGRVPSFFALAALRSVPQAGPSFHIYSNERTLKYEI